MKKLFYISIVLLCMYNKSVAQNANQTLSNLTAPTAVNTNLLPDTGNKHNLGQASRSWKDIYIKGSIFLDGDKFISNEGSTNTFIGSNAGYWFATASAVTATGYEALYSNSSGNNNTANGAYSLFNNNTGGYNTAIGTSSLYSNSSGSYNTATGSIALFSNTIGNYNTADGEYALYANTTGSGNTAVGEHALLSNTTGISNTATGVEALYGNTTGYNNVANGVDALYSNSTGSLNTADGVSALVNNTTGSLNTAVGHYALFGNNIGYYNTAAGYGALFDNSSSYYNTAVGYYAGETYDNGYNNVFLGAQTDVNGAGYYNVVAVGHQTICTASSQARIGNSSTTSIGGYANWSNVSDVRVKKNIRQNVPGLAFINKLQPITYNLDLEAADKITQPPVAKDKDGKQIQPTQQELDARRAKEQIVYTGFAAQDVEKAAKSLNYDFSGVDAAKNDKDLYGLRYSDFVVPLVKAVQELSQQNDSLKMELNELKTLILSQNNLSKSTVNSQQSTVTLSSASLQQNIPNPFSNSTIINYTLPQQYISAKIIITDKNGSTLKQLDLSGNGKGSVYIDASTLSSGTYQYSLMVNGKLIATKQMILSK